ncbi:MAG TPA: hypothetical protein VK961_11610 [Chthoniobacter sp.]|nr:hypothetical protein [Chthoniobacter sp.]
MNHPLQSSRSLATILIACVLLLHSSFPARAAEEKRSVDYSHYDEPLFDQIVDHIRVKVAARLADRKLTNDRYFIIPYAYEDKDVRPELSHSFMTVIRVFAHGKGASVTRGLKERRYKNWNFEAFTISWLPHDFDKNPDLCVFEGFGARLIPDWNKCPVVVGRDFKLEETVQLAVNVKNAVCMWGPYEITKGAFDLAVKRLRLLDSGKIKYRADDRIYRKDRVAINCFHAMAGLEELYPNGGIFGTGFKMWGINGTARVLIEYNDRGAKMGLLLEPMNEKKDRFGFVYAPTRDSRPIYNPFKVASVYHR